MTNPEEKTLYSENPSMMRGSPFWFLLCILLVPVGVGVIWLLIWWANTKRTLLTITDRRTTLRQGLLSVRIKELYHRDVRAVEIHQSLTNRILGVGSIGIASAGKAGYEIDVKGFPRVHEVKDFIDQYRYVQGQSSRT